MERAAFCSAALATRMPSQVANRILSGFRPSTISQQEYGWRAFQSWIASQPLSGLFEAHVLEFLVWLHEVKGLASQTIAAYKSSLAFPLGEAFGLDLSTPNFKLLIKSFFLKKPPTQRPSLRWDLSKVLDLLAQPRFSGPDPSQEDVLAKALFLTALATGNRGAEIAALMRTGIVPRTSGELVLPVKPGFLFKNQSASRAPPPVLVKALPGSVLCPATAILAHVSRSDSPSGALFTHPATGSPLNRGNIAHRICCLIQEADPAGVPKLHDLRKAAASIAWTRGLVIDQITKNAFWSSPHVFITRYLTDCSTGDCVALQSVPNSIAHEERTG